LDEAQDPIKASNLDTEERKKGKKKTKEEGIRRKRRSNRGSVL
jgi:hypothetical protein